MDGEIAASAVAAAIDEIPTKVQLNLNVEEAAGGCGSDSGVDVTPAVSCDSSLASGCYDPCKSPLGPFSPTETGGPSSLPCYPTSAVGYSRPSTPTWRRSADRQPCKLPSSMSSSFHFETARNSPPRAEPPKKTDLNAAAKQSKVSTVKKLVSTYDMVKSLDRYATLPRRRRKSKENLAVTSTSPAGTAVVPTPPREPSLNRAASLRRKHIEQGALAHLNGGGVGGSGSGSGMTASTPSPVKPTLPKATRPPPVVARTKIYHEVCSQTCLTGEDITKVLSGSILPPIENRVETNDAEVQVDLVEKRINALETELKEKTEQLDCKTKKINEQQECLKNLQERLNHDDLDTCRQIDAYSLRLCNIFQINDCLDPTPSNILEILENQVATTSSVINEQQKELNHLKTLCTSLHKDLEKSYAAQKSLLQANQASEMESSEIQDFLQAEKTMLSDTIKELEKEVKDYKEQLAVKGKEASKTMEQCTHLVRISEQRRQENLSLQAKMRVMENKSRELLQQQETTVSSAVVGLCGLGSRLDALLDKLVKSYSISEVDIEDEVYFNEAYTNGDSSSDSEQLNGSSNKSDSKSLMSAIVSAIKSAPTNWHKGKFDKNLAASTNSQESPINPPMKRLQTSESMKELQKTYSPVNKRNGSTGDLLSQTDSLDDCSDLQSAESESLNNLSEAIVARQQLELSMNNTSTGNFDFEFLEDFRAPDADLLDQVIDLDNTVTKLLKVITLVQTNSKEQSPHSERHEIKYTNGVNGKNRQYSSQSPLIHDSDESNCKRPPIVPMQELNSSSPKALNGIM
ncbi:girdin [Rhopalosiphum padi]|uniref:girdin n=1 Tax=Rhopalosiphum padi TaxID=40932 RepID=UPI00298E3756|nr:girdin [Rhopalosiphum padi]